MPKLKDLHTEIDDLPPNLRAEVLDFVQFVKKKYGFPAAEPKSGAEAESEDSPFFKALVGAGLVGCVETDEQLSTNYKERLNFSAK